MQVESRLKSILNWYKDNFLTVDSVLIVICFVTFIYTKLKLDTSYFNSISESDKKSLYTVLLTVSPTLLGFVITAFSIVISHASSDDNLGKLIRTNSRVYLQNVFSYAKWSFGLLTIVAFLFYLFDSGDGLRLVHSLLVIVLLSSIFAMLNIIFLLNDLTKLVLDVRKSDSQEEMTEDEKSGMY